MSMLTRRDFTLLLSALGLVPASRAVAEDKVVRIGFQKYGNLILLKGKGWLEKRLAPLGFKV